MNAKSSSSVSLVWQDKDQDHTFTIDQQQVIIGRGPTCDLRFQDRQISRRHARIFYENGQFLIEDLDSSLGTTVNGRVSVQPQDRVVLKSGDVITLGKHRLVFNRGIGGKEIDMTPKDEPAQSEDHQALLDLEREMEKHKDYVQKLFEEVASGKADPGEVKQLLNTNIAEFESYVTERVQEHIILHEIMQVICRILDIKDLLATVLRLVVSALGADRGCILLFNKRTRKLHNMVSHHFDPTSGETHEHDIDFSRTIANSCYNNREIIMIGDAMKHEAFRSAESIISSSIRSVICLPLNYGDEVHGVIYMDNLKKPNLFHKEQETFLRTFSRQTVIALQNAKLYTQAVTDDLTGLYNRKHTENRIQQEMQRAKRYSRPCSLLLLDIDHFKKVNDTYGHTMGDQVLVAVANVLKSTARNSDVVGRYGGEEFVILLAETDADGAVQFADRLREAISSLSITRERKTISVTSSFGVACFKESYGLDHLAFIDSADKALYRAKVEGRNRVILAEE